MFTLLYYSHCISVPSNSGLTVMYAIFWDGARQYWIGWQYQWLWEDAFLSTCHIELIPPKLAVTPLSLFLMQCTVNTSQMRYKFAGPRDQPPEQRTSPPLNEWPGTCNVPQQRHESSCDKELSDSFCVRSTQISTTRQDRIWMSNLSWQFDLQYPPSLNQRTVYRH